MMYCKMFSCGKSETCINHDNLCNEFQCCPKILATGLCSVCSNEKVCHIEREREKVKKNAKHGRFNS